MEKVALKKKTNISIIVLPGIVTQNDIEQQITSYFRTPNEDNIFHRLVNNIGLEQENLQDILRVLNMTRTSLLSLKTNTVVNRDNLSLQLDAVRFELLTLWADLGKPFEQRMSQYWALLEQKASLKQQIADASTRIQDLSECSSFVNSRITEVGSALAGGVSLWEKLVEIIKHSDIVLEKVFGSGRLRDAVASTLIAIIILTISWVCVESAAAVVNFIQNGGLKGFFAWLKELANYLRSWLGIIEIESVPKEKPHVKLPEIDNTPRPSQNDPAKVELKSDSDKVPDNEKNRSNWKLWATAGGVLTAVIYYIIRNSR